MKTLTTLLLIASLYGCATGYERKVDQSCSFLYFLPIPIVNALLANAGCILAADRAAILDEEEDVDDEDDDEEDEE